MVNHLQRFANHVLRQRGKTAHWACRREVVFDGGCFYDSVLANSEDKALAQTFSDRYDNDYNYITIYMIIIYIHII